MAKYVYRVHCHNAQYAQRCLRSCRKEQRQAADEAGDCNQDRPIHNTTQLLADTATGSALVAQVAIGIKHRSGKQTIAIFKCDELTAVEMSRQNQVVALSTCGSPN